MGVPSVLEGELVEPEEAPDLGALEQLRVAALGKSGSVTARLKSLGAMDPEARAAEGPKIHALREAVTNVVRHSAAGRCTVTLQPPADDPAALRLTVADDGKGPSGNGEGNGLSGLRERLAECGGTLTTTAGPEGGFMLRATVPSVP